MKDKTPTIVVLDAHTLNPGDLSWDALKELGDCTIYDRSTPEEVVGRTQDADIALTNKAILDRKAIESLPGLKYIGVMATGYNVVDPVAASEHGISVANVPLYATNSVAQMVFAYILEFAQQVAHHADTVRNGAWEKSTDFCYWNTPLMELEGKTLGIVGYGRIGKSVAQIALAFGMKVIVHNANPVETGTPDIVPVGLDTLFKESDVVSLHCPLNDQTEGIVNTRTLGLMKKSAILINTGRGPLINDNDLAEALNSGVIAGAALDVLTAEPPREGNPLISAKNCLITPHIAWATLDARSRLMDTVVGNVKAFIDGNPVNVVNKV